MQQLLRALCQGDFAAGLRRDPGGLAVRGDFATGQRDPAVVSVPWQGADA